MINKIFLVVLLLSGLLFSQHHTAKDIVQSLDELYRTESSRSKMEMRIKTPHWERTLKLDVWTKGMEKTFIRITSPPKEQGVATLRIGNEMWNYLPKTNKVIKIPPSMMMSSWMGSDFNNNDLVSEFSLLEDYHYKIIHPDTAGNNLIYLKCTPKKDVPIVWGHILVSVREKDYLPVREKYYDENDKLMRIMNFRDVTVFDDRKIPATMQLVPQNEKGHETVLKYLEAEFNVDIDNDIFSLRNLRTRR